jgi:dihydropteroate synthase
MPFTVRTRFDWRLHSRNLALGSRTLVMGILNATPDSFSDGGHFVNVDAGVDRALEMLDEGADLIDLGGESTKPNAIPVSAAEEQARVLPVLRAILAARPSAILSIDTYHAETARMAVEEGAEIINDVSGLLWDEKMAENCAKLGCGAILMHTRGCPQQWLDQPALPSSEVLPLVLRELEERAQAALAAGIAREAIVLDPGFGFGKVRDENYPLLAQLDELHTLGYPLLIGVSRKGFLRRTLSEMPKQSDAFQHATSAANSAAILAGAHILRVHDIRPAREAAAIADRILDASLSAMIGAHTEKGISPHTEKAIIPHNEKDVKADAA